jgi:hypothetical protein
VVDRVAQRACTAVVAIRDGDGSGRPMRRGMRRSRRTPAAFEHVRVIAEAKRISNRGRRRRVDHRSGRARRTCETSAEREREPDDERRFAESGNRLRGGGVGHGDASFGEVADCNRGVTRRLDFFVIGTRSFVTRGPFRGAAWASSPNISARSVPNDRAGRRARIGDAELRRRFRRGPRHDAADEWLTLGLDSRSDGFASTLGQSHLNLRAERTHSFIARHGPQAYPSRIACFARRKPGS